MKLKAVGRNTETKVERVLEGLTQEQAGDPQTDGVPPIHPRTVTCSCRGDMIFFLFNLVTKYTISSKINATIQYISPYQDPFDGNKN